MKRLESRLIVWARLVLVATFGCAVKSSHDQAGMGAINLPVTQETRQPNAGITPEAADSKIQAHHSGAQSERTAAFHQPKEAIATADDEVKFDDVEAQQLDEVLPPLRPLFAEPGADDAGSKFPEPPLVLNDVVNSVETNFPLLQAVVQEMGITSGQLLTAQGAFDLNLRTREFWQTGTYDSNRINIGVDQNTAWNGLTYYAGYRQATGNFPIYYGDRKTGDGGEFRAGLLIPLLAGRAIDKRRATIQQSVIGRGMADSVIAAQRLDFVRAASRAYWTWVATGQRSQIAQAVLNIAQERDEQLAELVQRGAVAEIERFDNQRVIVERQARLIAAERAWQQASIALSLYLRGPDGEPTIPSSIRLPKALAEPQPVDGANVADDVELALLQRPELQRLRLQKERTAVELDLARNQMLPGLNLGLEAAQDVGFASNFSKTPLVTGTQLDRATYVASLQLDVPLQQRDAKGRAQAAKSSLVQLTHQERFQRDRVLTELQDAISAMERSYELLMKARENLAIARKVESGERERFTKGQGTIVILNLRELVAAEAAFAEVDALAEYYRAVADYNAALGTGATASVPDP